MARETGAGPLKQDVHPHHERSWFERTVRRVRAFRLRWEHLHHVSLVTVALIAIAVFFVLGVVLRLALGPVSLGPFSDKLRSAVADAVPGLSVDYDDAAVEWSRDEGRVNLIIVGARVFDPRHHIIAQAPKAEIGVAAGPFIRGTIQIQRIALVGVQLTLVRDKKGALHLGLERNQTSGDVLERIRDALKKSGTGASSLKRFAVNKARLAFYDEGTGLFLVAPQAAVDVADETAAGRTHLVANVDASLEVTGRPAHVVAKITLPEGSEPLTGAVSVSGLELAALARNAKTFEFLQPFDLRTDLSASFVVVHGTELQSADLGISAAGTVGGFGSPLTIKNIRVVGRYDGRTNRLLIDDADLAGETAAAHAQGAADLTFANDAALTSARVDLTADKIAFTMPAAFQQTVTLGGVALQGTYTTADRSFTIHRLALTGSPVAGALAGKVVIAQNRSPAIELIGAIEPLSVRDLVRYWPLRAGEGARAWIAANMPAGKVGPVSVAANIKAGDLDKPALPEEALKLTVPVQDASVSYLKGMTPLTHANGTGVMTGDTFKMQLTSGRVGAIAVKSGTVTIPELHKHGTVGDIAFALQGQLRDLLTVLDEKPLQYPTKFHIKPAETAGAAIVDADFRVPMVKGVGVDRIPIKVKAVVNGLALTVGEKKLSNGNVTFDVDNSHLRAIGNLNYGRTPLAVDWTELFSSKTGVTTNLTAKGTLDEEARNALKLHLSDLLSGPVGVVAQLSGSRGTIRDARVTVDLTPATLSWDPISFKKGPGSAASAQISAHLNANGDIETADVSLAGSGLGAQGTLNFTPEGGIAHAEFPTFRAGPQNDFALSLSQTASHGFDVSLRGRSADGSAFGKRQTSSSGSAGQGSNTPYHVVARLDRLALAEGTVLAPFSLEANAVGNRMQTLSLSTGMSKGDSVTANITPAPEGRKLSVTATDAGLLLKGIFGLDNISGGRLTLNAKMPPLEAAKGGTDYAGTLIIRDFRIENQPFFARLFSAGSLGGLLDLMRGQGIVIDKLEMPFAVKNDLIEIHDGHASGPSVGLSGDGYIDRAANRMELRGAVAPIYGLNSVLGALPIVGNMLVSKQGEGIFGVTYDAAGSIDEPKIAVNPLSLLTPGILRRIFEGNVPTPQQQSDKAAAPRTTPH